MTDSRVATILGPGAGRQYAMGRIHATFKADAAESDGKFCVSEWWLEPRCSGPGAHSHPEDEIFYAIGGTMHLLVGETWHALEPGSCVIIPGGTVHDFENRSDARAGLFNVFLPGVFEQKMPSIAAWFAEHPPGAPSGGE